MNLEEIDRILGSEESIVASSGFTASVMHAIRAEADTPPPIAFPWRRAVPVITVAGALIVAVLTLTIVLILSPNPASTASAVSPSQTAAVTGFVRIAEHFGTGWLGFASAMTVATLVFGLRIAFPE